MKFLFAGTMAMLLTCPLISQSVFASEESREEQEKIQEGQAYGLESGPKTQDVEMQKEQEMEKQEDQTATMPEATSRPESMEETELEEE